MISARRLFVFSLMVLLILTACGIELYLADGNLATGWRNNVVRNWEQYGFLTLKGKLVRNPGGYEALTKPDVYPGHRPACLYPVFVIKRLFAWTSAGSLAFHIALSLAVLLSTWFLLGKNRVAWVAGAAAILCPGHTSYLPMLDPNTIVVMIGLPFAAIVLPWLAKPSLSPSALAVMLLLIVAYTALNWTTAFVHGMILAYLIVARHIPRRRVGLYVALTGVNVILVGGISVLEKRGGAGLMDLLGNYGWGSEGYGTFLTTDRAVVRLLFVGTAGLLPLLLVCGYVLAKRAKSNPGRLWLAFSPLAVAVIGVGVMRNFFGHHPWIAASVFLVGLVLSMRLVVEEQEEILTVEGTRLGGKILVPAAFLAGCFVYGAVVTCMSALQTSDGRALVALVRAHTVRSDAIVMVDTDTILVNKTASVSEYADRRVVVVHDLAALQEVGSRAFLVSTSGEVKLPLVATTRQPVLASWPLVQKMLALYSTTVARRLPGNRGLRPGTCYLYELKSDKPATNSREISGLR